MRTMRVRTALLLLLVPAAAAAQERAVRDAGLPRAAERRVLDLLADPATDVRRGPGALATAEHVRGALFVEGGPFTLAGRVEGDVVMVGGELVVASGARVGGEVIVVDGSLSGAVDELAAVTRYRAGGPSARRDDPDVEVRSGCRLPHCRAGRRGEGEERDRWDHGLYGDLDLSVRVGDAYNRVEGLPVLFGPVVHTGGRDPLRIEALAIWRSAHGDLDREDLGWLVRAEQHLLAGRLRLGASTRSTVDAIEDWHLSDVESSLATLLFRSDRRDWYAREGWGAHATLAPRALPLRATLEYRHEEHASAPVRDPWTLGGGAWRPQPLVAEGALRSLVGSVEVDTRDDGEDPYAGWLLTARVQRALDTDLALTTATGLASAPMHFAAPFTSGFLDVRRYLPVGRRSTLALRGLAAGALEDRALPPQLQHALGGVGSLPAFRAFEVDCGARDGGAWARGGRYPLYGCDRVALFQAEYRGGVDVHVGEGPWDDDDHWDIDFDIDWALFFDAGRGWALEGAGVAPRTDSDRFYDAGAGLLFGDLGIYWAVPLSGDEGGSTFFVRLQRRF